MFANAKRVYALAGFTVELRQKGWFYWRTYGEKAEAKGAYSSMASVTLMIARELKREITKRDGPSYPVEQDMPTIIRELCAGSWNEHPHD